MVDLKSCRYDPYARFVCKNMRQIVIKRAVRSFSSDPGMQPIPAGGSFIDFRPKSLPNDHFSRNHSCLRFAYQLHAIAALTSAMHRAATNVGSGVIAFPPLLQMASESCFAHHRICRWDGSNRMSYKPKTFRISFARFVHRQDQLCRNHLWSVR